MNCQGVNPANIGGVLVDEWVKNKRKKVLFRPIRELLSEAMREVEEVRDTGHLFDLCNFEGSWWDKEKAKIEFRYLGFDDRINWDTYLVVIDGKAAGYTNWAQIAVENNFTVEQLIKAIIEADEASEICEGVGLLYWMRDEDRMEESRRIIEEILNEQSGIKK